MIYDRNRGIRKTNFKKRKSDEVIFFFPSSSVLLFVEHNHLLNSENLIVQPISTISSVSSFYTPNSKFAFFPDATTDTHGRFAFFAQIAVVPNNPKAHFDATMNFLAITIALFSTIQQTLAALLGVVVRCSADCSDQSNFFQRQILLRPFAI
jgi:hypothetical protein